MIKKIRIISILILTSFSFYYTDKVLKIIKDNDPLMIKIKEKNKSLSVMKTDRIINDDEYITGINGCQINEEESYDRMKVVGKYKDELLVMKEDEEKNINDKYIIGGNNKNRNISIILFDNIFIKNEKINYFFDGKFINDNISRLKIIDNINIYNYGRNKIYDKKYINFDNSIINNNFNNNSDYCLLDEKNKEVLQLCSDYNMKTILIKIINDKYLEEVKTNIKNGNIFAFTNIDKNNLIFIINYIKSKGYNIVYLNELLSEKNSC